MNLSQALRWRYATKKFDPQRTVPEPLIETLLDAANLAATSYGLQPFQFVLLRNKELQEQLVASSYGQRQVADASHVIVIAIRTDIDEAYVQEYITMIEKQRGLPAGAMDPYRKLVMGTLDQMSAQHRQEWAARQAYIALGTLLAACASLELDSCPMEGFVADEYDERLGLKAKNLHATLVLPVGYRAEDDTAQHQPKVRKSLSEMVLRIEE